MGNLEIHDLDVTLIFLDFGYSGNRTKIVTDSPLLNTYIVNMEPEISMDNAYCEAHNWAFNSAIESGFKGLLMLYSTVCVPNNLIYNLMETNKDIVAPLIATDSRPPVMNAWNLFPKIDNSLPRYKHISYTGEIKTVDALWGCVLYSGKALDLICKEENALGCCSANAPKEVRRIAGLARKKGLELTLNENIKAVYGHSPAIWDRVGNSSPEIVAEEFLDDFEEPKPIPYS